jgi:hypothetical protein
VIAKLAPAARSGRTSWTTIPEKKIYIANSDDGIVTVVDAVKNTIIKQWKDMGEGWSSLDTTPATG